MFFLYSLLYSLAFLLMLPLFILRREKYASGFRERLGNYPRFVQDGRPVIWLHCVSVGETNAARPLVDTLKEKFPGYRLVISTTTKTGQELARSIFMEKADAIVYFPFDWKFSVRRALSTFRPSVVLLMETEIWPRLIYESKRSGSKVAIVNGRLSERSFRRYLSVREFVRRVLDDVVIAVMQHPSDAERIVKLGMEDSKVRVSGNLKFDHDMSAAENELTRKFAKRFNLTGERPLIIAASTHDPEEQWLLDAIGIARCAARVLIAPRHPQRFGHVADLLSDIGCTFARTSSDPNDADANADVILLDSIGELRALYPLADIVFVGGSLIPHGGQSLLEPASAGRAIITGPFTNNFSGVVEELRNHDAIVQIPESASSKDIPIALGEQLSTLLLSERRRRELGQNALQVMKANRGSTHRTMEELVGLFVPDR